MCPSALASGEGPSRNPDFSSAVGEALLLGRCHPLLQGPSCCGPGSRQGETIGARHLRLLGRDQVRGRGAYRRPEAGMGGQGQFSVGGGSSVRSRGHAPAKTEGSEDPPESLGLVHSSCGGSSTPEAPEHASGTRQAWSALHGGPGPTPVPEGPLCSPWPWAAQGWGSLSPPS